MLIKDMNEEWAKRSANLLEQIDDLSGDLDMYNPWGYEDGDPGWEDIEKNAVEFKKALIEYAKNTIIHMTKKEMISFIENIIDDYNLGSDMMIGLIDRMQFRPVKEIVEIIDDPRITESFKHWEERQKYYNQKEK